MSFKDVFYLQNKSTVVCAPTVIYPPDPYKTVKLAFWGSLTQMYLVIRC